MAPNASNEPPASNGKALASLILGILGFFCPILPSLIGLILGFLGLSAAKSSQGRIGGRGLSIAGIVTSGLSLVITPCCFGALGVALSRVQDAGKQQLSTNNLKQIALASQSYAPTFNHLPATVVDENSRPLLSWRVSILPFVEQSHLYNQFNQMEAWDGPQNRPLLSPLPPVYFDPLLQPGTTDTTYRGIVGPGTVFPNPGYQTSYGIANIPDGASNTIMAVEASKAVPWSKPDELLYTPGQMVSQLGNPAHDYFLVAM